jgi:HEAT repeat protein
VGVLSEVLEKEKNLWARLYAANALENIGTKAKGALGVIEKAKGDANDYVRRAAGYTAAVLKGETVNVQE